MALPAMRRRTLPGSRFESRRAGSTPRIFFALRISFPTPDFTKTRSIFPAPEVREGSLLPKAPRTLAGNPAVNELQAANISLYTAAFTVSRCSRRSDVACDSDSGEPRRGDAGNHRAQD